MPPGQAALPPHRPRGVAHRALLGVDLNDGHLACCVLDSSGNPIGAPVSIDVLTEGLRASRRDGRVRAAITHLLDHAQQRNCSAIVIENLDFADVRATGRERLGRGKRGKRLRRTVAGIPTARFRTRLIGMSARRDIAVIGVDAAYTSKWGNQHWRKPLQQQTSEPVTAASCRGGRDRADVALDWRSGVGRQDPATDSGPLRALHWPGPTTSRSPQNDGAAVPVHRHAHHEACRSTGKHPPPAANTVRVAQDSLLLNNQERFQMLPPSQK